MNDWQFIPLGQVCKVDKSKHDGSSLPYVGMENIGSGTGSLLCKPTMQIVKSSSFKFSKNQVLYGRLRSYLDKAFIADFDGHCSTEVFPITCSARLLPKFLLYWFFDKGISKKISETSTGARMPRANIDDVLDFSFPLPPLPEQIRIVAILDEAFAGISQAVAHAEKNLANARELFDSYLNQVFTRKGEGWEEKTLQSICEKITDGTHQTPKYFDEGYVFLSSRNVKQGVIDWENIKYIDDAQHCAMQKRLAPKMGDILLAKNGTTGVAAIVDRDVVFDIYVSLALIRSKGVVLSSYMLFFINSPVAKEQFNKRLKGVGVPNLHLNEIREVLISYPSTHNEQKQVVFKLCQIQENIQQSEQIYRRKLAALAELKQSLLQKAFTGELTASKS